MKRRHFLQGSALAALSLMTTHNAIGQSQMTAPEKSLKVRVTSGSTSVVFALNETKAAQELFTQLPLTVDVENFSTNEKIFYPKKKLNITGASEAYAKKGSLCYYAPWGNVVMFYAHFGQGTRLYSLGEAIEGVDNIEKLKGKITISVEN